MKEFQERQVNEEEDNWEKTEEKEEVTEFNVGLLSSLILNRLDISVRLCVLPNNVGFTSEITKVKSSESLHIPRPV